MNCTTVSSFPQQAQQWVNELDADVNWDERRACPLLRSVLHALRDWLSPEEMANLSAQLPVLYHGVYFDGWKPNGPAEDFIDRVQDDFEDDIRYDADSAISAAFRLLDRHALHGEIVQVRNSMKKSLRHLWPAA